MTKREIQIHENYTLHIMYTLAYVKLLHYTLGSTASCL